jgi:hypothetical protein
MSLPRYRVPQGASSAAAVKVAEVNRQLPITQLTERIPSGEPGLVPAASRESEIAAHRDALLDRVGSQVDKTDVIREISRLSFNKQAKNEAKQLVDEIFDAHYAAGGGPSMGGVAAGGEKSDLYAKAGFQAGRIRDPQVAARIASRGFRQAIEKSVPPGADRRALVALNQRLGRIKSLSKAVGASYNRGGAKLVPGLAAGAAEGIGLRRGLPLGSSLEYAALAATLARLGLSPAVESRAALMAAHPVSQALSRALPAGLAAAVTATRPRQAASADTARAGQSSQADLRRHLYQDKPLQASVPDPEEAGAGFAAQVMDEYGSQLSKFQARQLLRMHRASYADFVRELGDKAVYGTQKVLGWLGY